MLRPRITLPTLSNMKYAPVCSAQAFPATDCFDRQPREPMAHAKKCSEMWIAAASSRHKLNADASGAPPHGSRPIRLGPRKIKTQARGERGPSPRTTTALRPLLRTPAGHHLGTPRPMRSRVTTTDGRFPGSRVVAFGHLPRDDRSPVVFMAVGSPLTVAGAAAELHIRHCCRTTRTAFPWLSLAGTTVEYVCIGFHASQQG
jgi:hypothetical protein